MYSAPSCVLQECRRRLGAVLCRFVIHEVMVHLCSALQIVGCGNRAVAREFEYHFGGAWPGRIAARDTSREVVPTLDARTVADVAKGCSGVRQLHDVCHSVTISVSLGRSWLTR